MIWEVSENSELKFICVTGTFLRNGNDVVGESFGARAIKSPNQRVTMSIHATTVSN